MNIGVNVRNTMLSLNKKDMPQNIPARTSRPIPAGLEIGQNKTIQQIATKELQMESGNIVEFNDN